MNGFIGSVGRRWKCSNRVYRSIQ